MPILPDPVKTDEERAKEQANDINQLAERAIEESKMLTLRMFDLFWNNPSSTPAQISAVYGNNAYLLFDKLDKFWTALELVDSTFVRPSIPEKWEHIINQDGTVTITEKVEPPPEPEPEPTPEP